MNYTLQDLSDPAPPPGPADWNDTGVWIFEQMIPDKLIDAYADEWKINHGFRGLDTSPSLTTPLLVASNPGGYDEVAYMRNPALMALCTYRPLADALEETLGEPAGVHLNLSGWVSTERDWHQDGYLNPLHVGDYYAAVWVALGDIHPDSGPFQYIPGSHRWHTLTRDKIAQVVDLSDPMWPKHSETVLAPLVEQEVAARGAEVVTYLPQCGDVLFWHPRLYHRGSRAKVRGAYRPALIAHYSGIRHREDMPSALRHGDGWYFPLQPLALAHAAMRARSSR